MSASIKCPQCGKMMQSDAKVCGFCSYDLAKNQHAAFQMKHAPVQSQSDQMKCPLTCCLGSGPIKVLA